MAGNLLVISDHEEDARLGQTICQKTGVVYHFARTGEKVRAALTDFPQTVVLWGADDPQMVQELGGIIAKMCSPGKVFAVTNSPLNENPHLFKTQIWGHHLLRRFEGAATELYSRLVEASFSQYPFDLDLYFPKQTPVQRIMITRSTQKAAAVEAIQKVFAKQNVTSRLAALVAQAVDEAVMNAVFDAPVGPDGKPTKRLLPRDADFELLTEREFVRLEVACCEQYVGVAVSDGFGSLKKEIVLGFLGKDYHEQTYIPKAKDQGAGLGLNGLLSAGLSMVFISKPGAKTEVIVFFPRAENYKSFKTGFRFVSIIAE